MSVSGNEALGAVALHDALIKFTGCVGEALDDICSYGLTIGQSYVPFDPDPEDECLTNDDGTSEAVCSQAWVRVMGAHLALGNDAFGDSDCGAVMNLTLEVGVTRCMEIPEAGAAPTASDVLVAAMQSMSDMTAIHCAATSCDAFDSIKAGTWTPHGPLTGQYGGVWTFDVEI